MSEDAQQRIDEELKNKTGELDLSSCKLDHIPKAVSQMTWLTELDLQNNQISLISGLERMTNLSILGLYNNQINQISGLEGLTRLTRLDLEKNEIQHISGLESLTRLTRLELQNNQISQISGLEGLTSLEELYLEDNQISQISGLESLTHLTELDLDSNQIQRISGLENLSSLTNLDLRNNEISQISGLESLTSLNELYLGNNQISQISGLEGLTSLEELYLEDNQISQISGLESLTRLNELYLNNNQISQISGLESLTHLTKLNLRDNEISQISGLKSLTSLNELYLNNNQISQISGLESLTSLTTIDLDGNQIQQIAGLESLTRLNELFLGSNQISQITGLESLTSLTTLYLHNNQISAVGPEASQKTLVVLHLGNNPIQSLSANFQTFLPSLANLDLSASAIQYLSPIYDNLRTGTQLLNGDVYVRPGTAPNEEEYITYQSGGAQWYVKRGINVKDCPNLEPGLVAAIEQGRDAVLTYINAPKGQLFEARVLVLGEPRAGKTTLRRKLLDVTKPMPTEQESTQAFEIEVEPYECPITYDGEPAQLRYHLWDFGGQDYYRLLHQLFVTEQSVYIIVVDTDRNKNEEEIGFWLDTIERLGQDERGRYGPVILLQNPKNKRSGTTFTDLRKRYPFWQQTEDFQINLNALNKDKASFDKKALQDFRKFEQYLGQSFCRLEHVGKEMPVQWIAVREALISENANWVSIERFQAICQDAGIEEPKQQEDLLSIFRQLGYLLHYKDTALEGMVILNREWVTDALYRVLDDKIVEKNKGWFKRGDAKKIWHEVQYKNRTAELLALMQEFKLCYLNSATKKYIVPSKLTGASDHLPNWDETNNVQLRLQYDWMPKAVAIQLMVALHEYIVELPGGDHWIWRKGAVLDGKALDLHSVQVRIRDEYEEKRIAIDGRGPHTETLFRTLLKKWREVNEPFKEKVKVTPLILCPCKECAQSETPHLFRYESVLKAKQKGKSLQCNESFIDFEAEEILKGVYDKTTVMIDSLEPRVQKDSPILDLIRGDDLEAAIDTITSPEYHDAFKQKLEEIEEVAHTSSLSREQKTHSRNELAEELILYFASERLDIPYHGQLLEKSFSSHATSKRKKVKKTDLLSTEGKTNWNQTAFLAHASEDKSQVRAIYAKLKGAGLAPWLDEENLQPGERTEGKIQEAIKKCRFFLACISSQSVGKDGFIQKELRLALQEFEQKSPDTIYFIPVLLEDIPLPDIQVGTMSLQEYQAARVYDEAGLGKLIKQLQEHAGQ